MRHLAISIVLMSAFAAACSSSGATTNGAADGSTDACTGPPLVMCEGCCGARYAADQCMAGAWSCSLRAVACVQCDAAAVDSPYDARSSDVSATDASNSDASAMDAGEVISGDAGICATCGPASICVEEQDIGGGDSGPPNDAGHCPTGYVPYSGNPRDCARPPSFHCAQLPAACFPPGAVAPAHCVCAPSLCPMGQCTDVTPTLMQCLIALP